MSEDIIWNGCRYYGLDLIHQQMYARITELERQLAQTTKGKTYLMTTSINDLGKSLRALRQKRGMSLQQAGSAAGLEVEKLRSIELGQCDPWLDTLKKLASVYNESIVIEIAP